MILPLSFYLNPDVVAMAQALLGKRLLTCMDGEITGGLIIETEAYAGPIDRASHAYNNRRTKRTEIMYAAGGVAYIHLCYGIHTLLNVITGVEGIPHAVLIRALQPTHGIPLMQKRRKINDLKKLTNGPGSLTMALGITMKFYGAPLNGPELWIEEGVEIKKFTAGPRIGVDYAGPDALLLYRFLAK